MTITVAPRPRAAAIARTRLEFAIRIEEGVRLVEQQDPWRSVKRTGEGDALRLTRGQAGSAQSKPRIITVRQLQDEFVHSGLLSRSHDGLVDVGPKSFPERRRRNERYSP